jgi:ABC-type lipoprotein export system ATPase subunit
VPRRRVLNQVRVERSARVKQLEGMFDLAPTKQSEVSWQVSLPLEEKPWRIGLIHGPSGCGKSTIARELFHQNLVSGYEWSPTAAVVDGFPENMSIKQITGLLSSVGFSSPPAWLRPFQCLSNGEQFRTTVARALADPRHLVVIDEFTSVVDRTVARIGSAAVAKTVRALPTKQFVAVACHDDIVEWLQPDWTYEPHTGEFRWRSLQRRPAIEVEIYRCSAAAWRMFAHHHYLSADLSHAAECWLATVERRPAVFAAVINHRGQNEDCRREHRIVCLPDFQGVGLGSAVSEAIAAIYTGLGFTYYSRSGHPAMIHHRTRSRSWRLCGSISALSCPKQKGKFRKTESFGRLSASFAYVGAEVPPGVGQRVRDVDFTGVIDQFPNRTAERYCQILGVSPATFNKWWQHAGTSGRVERLGHGGRRDPFTYRVRHG